MCANIPEGHVRVTSLIFTLKPGYDKDDIVLSHAFCILVFFLGNSPLLDQGYIMRLIPRLILVF